MATTRVRRPRGPDLPDRLKPRKNPLQERSRALVEAILEAGARVLAERGWEAATTARIAEVAGISIGSLYQYFPDKVSLAAALIERQSEEEQAFHAARLAAVPEDASLQATLRAVVESALAFQAERRPLHRALLDAMPHVGRHDLLVDRVRASALGLRHLLERHRAQIAHDDLDLATHVVVNAIHSVTHDGILRRPDALDDARLAREVERLVLGYLGVTPTR